MLVETPHEKIISSWHIHVGEHQIPVFPYKRIWSNDRSQSGLVTDHEHLADAHLIAAAPELLEVLQAIISDGMHCDVVPHLHEKARAAIAKAKGEKS
jgi:hypothetical protein